MRKKSKCLLDYKNLFSRNIGFLSSKDQKRLSRLSIGIAGVGGDGGLLAERLARFGVGHLLLADPDFFEAHNVNRQFGANSETVGKNKAQVVARELSLINPKLKVRIYTEGVTEKNVKKFVSESDIIVDEIDFSMPHISVMLAREARKQKKYVFMGANIGWGASLFCFSPKGMTFEEYFAFDEKSQTIDPTKYLVRRPAYFSKKLLKEIINGNRPAPGLASSVGLVASLVSSQLILLALKKKKIAIVPKVLFFDFFNFN